MRPVRRESLRNLPHLNPGEPGLFWHKEERVFRKAQSRDFMKMMLNVRMPHREFNQAVKDGTVGAKLGRILESIKPEAAYFTEHGGQRGAVLIVDVPDPAIIPALAEPWFLAFCADVELRIVMSPEDLKRAGLEELGKKWSQG